VECALPVAGKPIDSGHFLAEENPPPRRCRTFPWRY